MKTQNCFTLSFCGRLSACMLRCVTAGLASAALAEPRVRGAFLSGQNLGELYNATTKANATEQGDAKYGHRTIMRM